MMFQIDGWSAKVRWYVLVPLLIAVTAETASAGISRQQEPGRRPSTTRVRSCAQCAGMDSLETQRAKLLDKFESLKWEFENKRLNELERDRVVKEMAVTMAALEDNAEATMRFQGVMIATEVGQARRSEEALAQALAADRPFQPRGYIGVTFDGLYLPRDEEMTIRFFAYPRIALVEPSSPAERAGIVVGDTLVSVNGSDLREQEIPFGKLLIPNKRLTMRVRRDGESRELRLTVAEAPESFLRRSRTPTVQVVPLPRSGQVSVIGGRGGSRVAAAPIPQGSSAGGYVYWFGNDALGGARMQTITAGLAKAMNVKQGVLILTVAPGSPAWESGLREGDVVIHADGDDVRTINDVQRAIAASERDRAVKLVVVSEGRKRDLTFRW